MGPKETAFLEAGPRTIRPLEQRGGSSGSQEGGPRKDLGTGVATENQGNEPIDEAGSPTSGCDSQHIEGEEEGEEGRRSKGLSAPMNASR